MATGRVNDHGGAAALAGTRRPWTRLFAVLCLVLGVVAAVTPPAAAAGRPRKAPPRVARSGLGTRMPRPTLFPLRKKALGGTWRIEHTPNVVALHRGVLNGDSCASPGTCTAVGSYENVSAGVSTLAMARVGGRWRRQVTPSPAGAIRSVLSAVSCTSADACTAVGRFYRARFFKGRVLALAERWNGRTWRIQATPGPAGSTSSWFYAVSCVSARACTAAGYFTSAGTDKTLAESWNGRSWRVEATPVPAGATGSWLYGVSCTSATACTAVGAVAGGQGTQPLAERWNGAGWQVQASAGGTFGSLSGVSCSSARSCVAVGPFGGRNGTATLAEAWHGQAWRVQATPNPAGSVGSQLLSVSCSSPGACTAVGAYSPDSGETLALAERWNGTSWRLQAAPNPAGTIAEQLAGVSCPSAGACTAAGNYGVLGTQTLTLAVAWAGTSWRVQATPTPTGADGTELSAVSCSSPAACTAVGWFSNGVGDIVAVAERWDGRRWRLQDTASPAGSPLAELEGVSCRSPAACTAVGWYQDSTGSALAFAESWNGARWRIRPLAGLAGASQSQLKAVSCTAPGACTAVGQRSGLPLVEAWDGTSWHLEDAPIPSDASGGELFGVSCASATACTAVGEYYNSGPDSGAMTESWNGTSWQLPAAPNPVTDGLLLGVSCTSPSTCTAVGYTGAYGGGQPVSPMALVEAWDGTTWRTQQAANPAGDPQTGLSGVWCTSPAACTAVGDDGIALAEVWNGTRWELQFPPAQAHSDASALDGVWCASARACTAVGTYNSYFNIGLTLAVTTAPRT
jgi:hypothetical protein